MKKLLFVIFLIPALVVAQTQLRGIVINAETKQPLPFATVQTNTNSVTLTDVDGNFFINTNQAFTEVTILYVGFSKTTVSITEKDTFISINLKPTVENLNEVYITATENPALEIIRKTIENKPLNNIEKALNYFEFNTYTKILVTANPDSISSKIDSVFFIKNGEKIFDKLDSTNYEFKKETKKQHLYISEKISTYKFEKGKKTKEIVIASRMAGLKQPIYEVFAVTFQDFSFYNEEYTIAGTNYTNPIANNALKQYQYQLLDTVNNGHGTSYLIYFKPTKKKAFLGIEGVLYIDTQSFAITKAIAELKGVVNVKATQNYEYVPANNRWFPSNKNIAIKKGDNEASIALFGGLVKFNEEKSTDTIVNTAKNKPDDVIYFISTSQNSNIKINEPLKVKRSALTIQFNDDAATKSNEFWNIYRTDSLTKRGENTYIYLDSIAESEQIEKKINLARNLLNGFYPTKYINLDLGKILNVNNYEGFRIGFGGITNTNFSQKFKIEAYGAYGTKDTRFKYSFGGAVRLNQISNTWIGAKYTDDIREAAAFHFIAESTSFTPINPRNINLDKFYSYKTTSAFLYHNLQPDLDAKMEFSAGKYDPLFEYEYVSPDKAYSEYSLTTVLLGFNYTPKSEFMNTPLGKMQVKNGFPQFTFQITQSLEDVLGSDFGFTHLNLRILHKIERLRRSITSFLFEGGIVFGQTPISHLYNATPNYTYKNPWAARITFAGKNSFETMVFNEFISDRFVALHIKHQFKAFKISRKFNPQLTLVTRAAIGDIHNPQYQTEISFSRMNEGFFESGFELNSLFRGFGASAFYRYGPYENLVWSNNLSVKITYNIRLGF
jgi:hypothetical protein